MDVLAMTVVLMDVAKDVVSAVAKSVSVPVRMSMLVNVSLACCQRSQQSLGECMQHKVCSRTGVCTSVTTLVEVVTFVTVALGGVAVFVDVVVALTGVVKVSVLAMTVVSTLDGFLLPYWVNHMCC